MIGLKDIKINSLVWWTVDDGNPDYGSYSFDVPAVITEITGCNFKVITFDDLELSGDLTMVSKLHRSFPQSCTLREMRLCSNEEVHNYIFQKHSGSPAFMDKALAILNELHSDIA